jgi:mono/diheme cytochrome c family protein
MVHMRDALFGIAAFLGIAACIVVAIVYLGYVPMMADNAPSALESRLAMKAVHAISERQMGDRKSPIPATRESLAAGLKIYAHNCLMCHGAADGKASTIAAGFYVPAPQFASDGSEDDPEGATYWKIRHGIRFSAMPSFMHSLPDVQIWQVTMFLKHMDELPKNVDVGWKALPSVGGGASVPKMDMK